MKIKTLTNPREAPNKQFPEKSHPRSAGHFCEGRGPPKQGPFCSNQAVSFRLRVFVLEHWNKSLLSFQSMSMLSCKGLWNKTVLFWKRSKNQRNGNSYKMNLEVLEGRKKPSHVTSELPWNPTHSKMGGFIKNQTKSVHFSSAEFTLHRKNAGIFGIVALIVTYTSYIVGIYWANYRFKTHFPHDPSNFWTNKIGLWVFLLWEDTQAGDVS